jgi:DNA-binding XRE family transcriptional regulator
MALGTIVLFCTDFFKQWLWWVWHRVSKKMYKIATCDVVDVIVMLGYSLCNMQRYNSILLTTGENIKKLRRLQKLSQEDLAALIGIHRNNLSKIETGKVNIPLITLFKIAQALKTSSQDLLPF